MKKSRGVVRGVGKGLLCKAPLLWTMKGVKTKKTYMKHVSLFVIAKGFFQDPWGA